MKPINKLRNSLTKKKKKRNSLTMDIMQPIINGISKSISLPGNIIYNAMQKR